MHQSVCVAGEEFPINAIAATRHFTIRIALNNTKSASTDCPHEKQKMKSVLAFALVICGMSLGGTPPESLAQIAPPRLGGVTGPAIGAAPDANKIVGAVTQVQIQNTVATAQTNVPLTFGQVFGPGDVSQNFSLAGRLADGTSIPLQVNVKARHPDGSLRHAVISAVLPALPASQVLTLGLMRTAAATPSSQLTPADLINAGFVTNVQVNLAGQVYTASANALLGSGPFQTWIAGPVANEWLVSSPLKTAGGNAHPHLSARFAVRWYPAQNKAKVDVILENAWAFEPAPQNFTYDIQVNVGGQSVYSKSALTHFTHARWRKSFWWGAAPQIHIKHDTAYLISTKAVPYYDPTVVISPAALSSIKSTFSGAAIEPMGNGMATPYMPTTGGRPDIGLLPGWAVSYLLSMDLDAKNATLGTADLAGSWSAHYRNRNTDRPVSLIDYPYMTILGRPGDTYNPVTKLYESFPVCGGDCDNPNVVDDSHQPGFAYLPYLVTGEHYYLEELQFWAMWNLFESNPGYRDNIKGLFHPTQIRGQAWILRTVAEAAYITPDADIFKAQFAAFLSDNLDWYNNAYSNNPHSNNSLGAITDGNAIVYDGGVGLAPWQDDFFTSAAGHAVELGFAKAKPLLNWKAKFPIGRMVDPGFCWIVGGIYNLHVRDTAVSPIYTTLGQAYLASNPSSFTSLPCGGSAMAANLGLQVGEMTGYSYSNSGYPSNMQPALAYAADSGVTGGVNAWQVFMGRSVLPDYQNGAQFAIVPRPAQPPKRPLSFPGVLMMMLN
ncbi:hypothetical protein BH11PSE11_BH11PSE11_28410 [soil metagenome]